MRAMVLRRVTRCCSGSPRPVNVVGTGVVDGHAFERSGVIGKLEIELPGHRVHAGWDVARRNAVVQGDQPLRFGIGQRIEHDAVHDGEERGVCANGQCQRQRRGRGEERRSNESSCRLANLLCDHVHDSCLRDQRVRIGGVAASARWRRIVRTRRAPAGRPSLDSTRTPVAKCPPALASAMRRANISSIAAP